MFSAEQILYEDNHLIAINKRVGQIVQADKTGDVPLIDELKAFIKQRDGKPGNVFCGLIHRLDRPVSGVVLFAKTSKALSRMTVMVRDRQLTKSYWAVVKNAPPNKQALVEDYLKKNEAQNKSYVVDANTPGAKVARLEYALVATSDGGYHLLEVNLLTGRHHQIRCQLAHMGSPIKGDLKYGAPRSNADGSISLHARRIAFEHPVSHEQLTIVAPNEEFERMFRV
ncbi:MAG: RluA family pseudouridine synthase [Bacteroidales bacterium]|nr:RluA family pseudouridine synthase [Bacteroidales bacterium]